MPKIKTHKSTSKRFKITKNGKIIKRTGGQGHFNSRESGKVTRNKRSDSQISDASKKTIVRAMPHA
ncbi:MAG: 50S ribosomal protein L35 [Candidatus Magasanikbacteria bacterium]|nr:50S ribosomal protein L35 [Candidatus Magasanikbacteria bacterium]|tara:strand:- start:3754 stop:3951 length:198 start_codon:yes stop_codon:yes gene_type:complete